MSKDLKPIYDEKGNITHFKISVAGIFRLAEFEDKLIGILLGKRAGKI